MTFEELQIEELNHINSDLKQQLNYELRKNTMLNKQLDALVALGDKISHQNEELEQTIEEIQNDLNQARNEIKLLNKQIIDKIIAEIMQLDYDIESVDYDSDDMPQTEIVHTICREELLHIIDKYKVESEEKTNDIDN